MRDLRVGFKSFKSKRVKMDSNDEEMMIKIQRHGFVEEGRVYKLFECIVVAQAAETFKSLVKMCP